MKKYLNGVGLKNVLQRIKDKLDLKANKDELAIQSNPNLLDNWYFVNPINQRGQTEYTSYGYTIDRWINKGTKPKVTLNDKGTMISLTEAGTFTFSQILNPELRDAIGGKTVTASAFTNKGLFSFSILLPDDWSKYDSYINGKSALIPGNVVLDLYYGSFRFWSKTMGAETNLIAAKLELGSIQTLAHKEGDTWVLNDPLPDPALELAKCQRYFYAWNGSKSSSLFLGSSDQYIGVSFPVTMRNVPAITNITINSGWADLEFVRAYKDSAVFIARQSERSGEILSFYADANL